jgi:hypothetical protein
MNNAAYGVSIGKDVSGRFKPTPLGLGVQTNDGRLLTYAKGALVDVTNMAFAGTESYVYRLPIQKPQAGDLIILSDNPFRAIFVEEAEDDEDDEDDKDLAVEGRITGIDPASSQVVEYVQPKNGTNQRWFVRVFSPLNGLMAKPELAAFMPIFFMKGTVDWFELALLAISGGFGDVTDRALREKIASVLPETK